MAKVFGVLSEKAGEFYEIGAVIQRPLARFNAEGSWTVIHFDSLL